MNRSKLALLSIVALSLFACTKGDDEKTPQITSISPASGGPGSTIYVAGKNFTSLGDSSGCIKVYFQNKSACAYVRNDDTLEITVPFDAGDGPVCVKVDGQSYCTPQAFNYLPGNLSRNSFMQLADAPNSPTNQVAAMGATNDAIIAGFINWWKYDIDKNTWSDMVAPTDKFTRMASFTFSGKAYFFGGYRSEFSNRLQCYDPVTNSWSFKTPMPATPRADAVAFVWNNKVYIAGGQNSFSYGGNTVAREVWQYDPVADSWVRKSDMPAGASEGYYAMRIGAKFYVPGPSGYGAQAYDPQTDQWTLFPISSNLPMYVAHFSDKDFALGYSVGGPMGASFNGHALRYAINYTGSQFTAETYGQNPSYMNVGFPFYAVVNNELYYGMAYQNVNGTQVRDNKFWRYKY